MEIDIKLYNNHKCTNSSKVFFRWSLNFLASSDISNFSISNVIACVIKAKYGLNEIKMGLLKLLMIPKVIYTNS